MELVISHATAKVAIDAKSRNFIPRAPELVSIAERFRADIPFRLAGCNIYSDLLFRFGHKLFLPREIETIF